MPRYVVSQWAVGRFNRGDEIPPGEIPDGRLAELVAAGAVERVSDDEEWQAWLAEQPADSPARHMEQHFVREISERDKQIERLTERLTDAVKESQALRAISYGR